MIIGAGVIGVYDANGARVDIADADLATLSGSTGGNVMVDRGAGAGATTITAHAGGGQASATALISRYNNVTVCATIGDSVKLPVAALGLVCQVRNLGATACEVFPVSGSAINALAADAGVMVGVGAVAKFVGVSATGWVSETSVYVPAPTTEKGGLRILAADSAGNTTTNITNASQAAVRTYTIPDAGASANFVMSVADGITQMTTTATPASGSNGVQFVFKNGAGVAITGKRRMLMWLSDINGEPVTAQTSFAALTNGTYDNLVTGKQGAVNCSAAGLLGITLTAAAATYYISFSIDNGTILTSSAIVVNA